jgi:nitrous oxidase accessory protein
MRLALAILLALAGPSWAQLPAAEMAPPAAGGAQREPAALVNSGVIGQLITGAKPGAIVRVPAGVYREHIRIDRALTLVGEGRPVIDGGGNGDIIEIAAPGVTVEGFIIRNTGIDLDKENAAIRVLAPHTVIQDNVLENILFGIDLREAPGSVLRRNTIGGKALDVARRGDGIRLWRSNRTILEGNTIHDGRDAVLWYSQGITVRGNTSLRCRYGLHLMYSDEVVVEDNTLSENSVGVYIMYSKGVTVTHNRLLRNRGPSGYGLGLKETDRFVVEHNVVAGNRVGIYLDGSPFSGSKAGEFKRNTIGLNDIGMTFLPAVRGNQFTENNFIDNVEQISIAGRGQLRGNDFWKGDIGNFWSDYVGYDQDRNGIGDFVHESSTLFENLLDREPKLRILLFSPAQQAIELVGRALPAVRPEPKFTDEVPLMRPVAIATMRQLDGSSRSGLASVALASLAVGVCLVLPAAPCWRRARRDGRSGEHR